MISLVKDSGGVKEGARWENSSLLQKAKNPPEAGFFNFGARTRTTVCSTGEWRFSASPEGEPQHEASHRTGFDAGFAPQNAKKPRISAGLSLIWCPTPDNGVQHQ